jgi:putative NADH-flavin reductase
MKICVFGASGKTGVEVVKYAEQQGFEVVKFMGDVLEYSEVYKTLQTGTNSVVSVIGHIKDSTPRVQAIGTANIAKAMQQLGITRIVTLTGTGVRLPSDSPSFVDNVLNTIVKLIDPDRVADGVEHVKVLSNSQLDWTVVRVLKLSSRKPKKEVAYKLTSGGPAELISPRCKVAKAIVDLVVNHGFIGQMPVISK